MKIVKDNINNEIIIEKSRFIAHLKRVSSIDDAVLFLESIKKQYWDASHNCYAFVIGQHGEIMRSNDDGEPSKTAGVPILEVLKKNTITDTICVITRYFGGVKLGAGGLVRAYSKATSEAIKKANFVEIRTLNKYSVTIDYTYNNTIEVLIKEQATLIDIIFSDTVTYLFASSDTTIIDKITNQTKGQAIISFLDTISVDVDVL